jgi:hypothetical protein
MEVNKFSTCLGARHPRTVMDSDEAGFAAVAETTSFLNCFRELQDHRQLGK